MTMPTIQIGSGEDAYTFEVPVDFRPRVETVRSGTGVRIGERHVWPVRGFLLGAEPGNVSEKWDGLLEVLSTEEVSCFFKHGEATLETLSASDAERGPRFSGLQVTSSGENAWDGRLEFNFEIAAEFYDASGDVVDSSSETACNQLADGTLVRRTSGALSTRYGSSAKAAAEALAPAVPAGYRLAESSVTVNADDTEAAYVYELCSLFSALPSGVRIAERVDTEAEAGGERRVTRRATFTGPGAAGAAERHIAEARFPVVERMLVTHEDAGRVEALYTTIEPVNAGARISFSETVDIEGPGREVTEFPVDGQSPLIMLGAARAAVVRQVGRAVHRGEVPPERAFLDHPGLVRMIPSSSVEADALTCDAAAGTFERRWDYTYLASDEDAARAVAASVREIIEG